MIKETLGYLVYVCEFKCVFFVTLTSIVYIELLPNWGDNVTKNDTLFFSYLLQL